MEIQKCCLEAIELDKNDNKYVVFQFSNPTEVKLSLSERVWGRNFKHMSHIEEHDKEDKKLVQTFFRLEDKKVKFGLRDSSPYGTLFNKTCYKKGEKRKTFHIDQLRSFFRGLLIITPIYKKEKIFPIGRRISFHLIPQNIYLKISLF
jgi:hypothetical protein